MDRKQIWRECNECGKKLASYKTLWQHKKTCKHKIIRDGKGITLSKQQHSPTLHNTPHSNSYHPVSFDENCSDKKLKKQGQASVTGDIVEEGPSNEFDIGNYTWKDRGVERHHSFLLPKKSNHYW